MLIFENDTEKIITDHAKMEYPNECCGILLGKWSETEKTVSKIIPTENSADKKAKDKNFLIPPLELYKAEQNAEEEGLEILGFYHSHPEYEAVVSRADSLHMIPGYSYPIISVKKQFHSEKKCEIRSFIKSFKQKHTEEISEEEIKCR